MCPAHGANWGEGVAPGPPAQPPCPAGREAPTLSLAPLIQLASVDRKPNIDTLQMKWKVSKHHISVFFYHRVMKIIPHYKIYINEYF